MDELRFTDALELVWKIVSRAHKYIDETEPWKLAQDPAQKDQLDSDLAHLAESLRLIALHLLPVMTHAPVTIFGTLGLELENEELQVVKWGALPAGAQVVETGTPIFPRLDAEEEVAYIQRQMTPGTE